MVKWDSNAEQTVEYLFEFNENLPKFNASKCQAGLENISNEKKITS